MKYRILILLVLQTNILKGLSLEKYQTDIKTIVELEKSGDFRQERHPAKIVVLT